MVSIGLYSKQFVFFLAIALAVGAGVWYIRSQQQTEAAPQRVDLPSTSVASLTLEVRDGGTVRVSDQTLGGLVEFEPDREVISYQAFQQDGTFVDHLTTTVALPRSVPKEQIVARHFGTTGVELRDPTVTSQQSVVFQASNLSPKSAYRLEVVVPKGSVRPGPFTTVVGWVRNLSAQVWLVLALTLPALATLVLALLFMLAQRTWRGPSVSGERSGPPLDSTRGKPGELPPAVVGVLMLGKVSPRTLAATLLDLARRDYLQVVHKPEGFTFGKRRALESLSDERERQLADFERTLLSKIFRRDSVRATQDDIQFRIGHHIFSRKIAEVYLAIYQLSVDQGWFVEDPQRLYQRYRFLGLSLSVVAVILFVVALAVGPAPYYYTLGFLALFFVGVVMREITPFLPRRTHAGDTAYREWLEFRNYLSNAAPIKSIKPAPGQTPLGAAQGLYQQYLPYAVAMGVEVEWTERFLDLTFSSPVWYSSEDEIHVIEDFANSLFPIIGTVATDLARAREPFAV